MSLRVSCASLILATSCTLAAQPTCPQPNFLRPQPFNLLPSSTSLDVVRQPDGSYTGFEVASSAPYRTIATTPHLEQQLAACLGHAIPTKPSLTSFNANPSGAGSQLQVSEALAGGGYFVAKLSSPDSTLILFDIFDAQHNLLSETSFTAPLTPPPFPASTEFFSLLLGDVNGDGIPDLLAVFEAPLALSIRNGGVWTFLGNGDGTFRTGIASVLTARGILAPAITAAVGDLNGDGKLDVVLAAPNSGPVLFATGNGDGTFNPADQVLYPLGPTTQATVTLADLNSDGKLDIVASGGSGVTVLLGNGDGTFQPPMVYAVLGPFGDLGDASYANVAVGDVNGDGHPDIVTSGGSILFGDGKGAFPTRRDYSLSMSAAGAASVMLADLDGDGNVDLIFGNGNPAFLSGNGTDPFLIVLFGTGGGKFTGAPMTTVPTGAEVAADFTGDGIPDLAIVTPSGIGYQVSVLPGVGDGTFQPPSGVEGVLYGGTPHYAFTADFNRDGKADLAILTGALVVFLGKGDGTFGAPQSLAIPDFTVNYLVTADLNGDGFPDILAVGESNIYAFLGKGDGTFSPIAGSIAASEPALAVGDFNGDGKPDLAFANKGASALNVLPGKGDGTFGTAIVTTLPAPALGEQTNIAAADFDGDGRLDIALTLDAEVAVFPGRGDGTFGSPRLTPGFLADLTAIDLNDDGVIDLVGDNGGSEVAGCLGNGDGTFQPCARISGPFGPYLVADFNRDGLPDVAVSVGTALTTYLNFSRPLPPLTVVSAASFLAGPLAPGSIAAAFGAELPVSGTTVEVQDSAGTTRGAQIYYASSTQINFVIPAGTAPGPALVTVSEGLFAAHGPASVTIAPISPALFTAVQENAYLVLYGTGFDAATTANTTISIQGISLPVSYAGVQPTYAGLDQINVALPPSLLGTGAVSISASVAGQRSNIVSINLRPAL